MQATVTGIRPIGAFVELSVDVSPEETLPVTGLVYANELSWDNPNPNPSDIVQVRLRIEAIGTGVLFTGKLAPLAAWTHALMTAVPSAMHNAQTAPRANDRHSVPGE